MPAKPTQRPAGWAKTGRDALAALEQEQKNAEDRQNKPWMPYRLWLPKGGETEVIILDEAFVSDEAGVGGAFIREHNLKGQDGKWGLFESCCADFAPCALCDKAGTEGFGAAQGVVMLTVLELREWTNKKTGEVHKYSRKLLPIKLGQKDLWLDLQQRAIKAQGSMRGMYQIGRASCRERVYVRV